MADKAWKRTERQVAKELGGVRVPITGRQRGDAPDVAHADYSIEVKYRQRIPAWILDGMEQAIASKTADDDLPVLIIRAKGQGIKKALVCMELGEFKARYGDD